MRAKTINENNNFERNQDPKKSMNLGYSNMKGYVERECEKAGLDSDNFWDEWNEMVADSNDTYELLDTIHSILEHTPLEYQIDYIDRDLQSWIEDNAG